MLPYECSSILKKRFFEEVLHFAPQHRQRYLYTRGLSAQDLDCTYLFYERYQNAMAVPWNDTREGRRLDLPRDKFSSATFRNCNLWSHARSCRPVCSESRTLNGVLNNGFIRGQRNAATEIRAGGVYGTENTDCDFALSPRIRRAK